MIILRKNSKGTAVMILQHLLNVEFYPLIKIKIDGDFGSKTKKLVLELQGEYKLKVDGVVGKKTWKSLGMNEVDFPKLVTTVRATSKWYPIAKAEYGVSENTLIDKHNKRIIEFHSTTTLRATTDEVPWCSSFVNWVMIKAGYKGTNSALAKSWLKWGRKMNSPREGAIVVVKRKNKKTDSSTGSSTGYHVAFFVRKTSTHITLLGGNQGNKVKESNYRLSSYNIEGYRWPI